jgi:RsmE family RNA methyltransferase
MNLLLFDRDEISAAGSIVLRADDARTSERHLHVYKVLRPEPGTSLRIGLVNGAIGTAIVCSIARERIELTSAELTESPPPPLPVTLVLALPRPKFLGRILQATATLGIKDLVLLQSARVEKSYWRATIMAAPALERHLRLGLEQGRDTVLPVISLEPSFRRFVELRLPALLPGRLGLVAHGTASVPMPRSRQTATTLLIGPEGGLLDDEVAALVTAGMTAVTLGPRPLRVETAVAVAVGRLLSD